MTSENAGVVAKIPATTSKTAIFKPFVWLAVRQLVGLGENRIFRRLRNKLQADNPANDQG